VFDTRSTTMMTPPRVIANDPVVTKRGRHELGDATVPTVGKDAPILRHIASIMEPR
jgi:hypothetical protein